MTVRDDIDVQTWEWIDGSGVVHAMNLTNGIVTGRSVGTAMPPIRRVDRRVPGRAGAFTLDRNYAEKSVAIAATLHTADAETLEEAIAEWASRFNVLLGGGALARTRADGVTRRLLYCDYDDGFGIDQQSGIWRRGTQQAVLTFFAADPWWYDDTDTVVTFTTGTGVGFFPIPNPTTGSFITLTSSEVFGSASIDNDGDAPVYPVWTITGPGSSIRLVHDTTGDVLDFTDDGSLTLAAGDVLTVDTRPGYTRVEVDGTNVANHLTDESTLWPLALGTQTVHVEMSGSTGASEVELAYARKHLTP